MIRGLRNNAFGESSVVDADFSNFGYHEEMRKSATRIHVSELV